MPCVLKPATETPLTAYAVADLLEHAGLPAGVVNVITTSSPRDVVGAMLQIRVFASSPSPDRPRSAADCSVRPRTAS